MARPAPKLKLRVQPAGDQPRIIWPVCRLCGECADYILSGDRGSVQLCRGCLEGLLEHCRVWGWP